MLTTPSPLTERMTLFWHNHFTSGQDKVGYPQLMAQQNMLLRRDALGNFGELLHDVAKDPAMLQYLDGAGNRKGKPNENFAREVMELFTLGEGHYTQQRRVGGRARLYRLEPRPGHPGVRVARQPARRRRQDGARSERAVRRRSGARHPACAAGDRDLRHDQAVARVRLRYAGPARRSRLSPRIFVRVTTTSRSRCAVSS